MKTKWRLYVLWSVLSLGLLSCAVNTYDSPLTRRKRILKLEKPIKESETDERTIRRSPGRSSPPGRAPKPRSGLRIADIAYVPDVSVTCSTSDFVVRVKPSFYGMGAGADELKLGSACRSNGVLGPYGDLLFTYPLTACDAVRESPHSHLIYKFELHYEPSPRRLPSRAQRIDVDIECHYPRNHHVHQLTVRPTWEPVVMRKSLKGSPDDFRMELMDDSWSGPAKSQLYQLGNAVNVQVSAPHLSTGGKLYINSCYATPSSGSHKYSIINNFGCMVDSKSNTGASQFISRTDRTLRFSLKAFQFVSDPDAEVSIHCKLFVTSEDPGPSQKSCTYSWSRWEALSGDDSVCECCDSQCVTSKPRRPSLEGSASIGSLLVSDQPHTAVAEGKATSSDYISELHEDLWESSDVDEYDYDQEQDYDDEEEEEEEEELEEESGFIVVKAGLDESEEVLTEDDGSEKDYFTQFEEDVSGDDEDDEEELHLDHKYADVLHHWELLEHIYPTGEVRQRVLQLAVGEEDNRTQTGRHEEEEEEEEGVMASEVDDNEMTYFSWIDLL